MGRRYIPFDASLGKPLEEQTACGSVMSVRRVRKFDEMQEIVLEPAQPIITKPRAKKRSKKVYSDDDDEIENIPKQNIEKPAKLIKLNLISSTSIPFTKLDPTIAIRNFFSGPVPHFYGRELDGIYR
jgi:hypothetical protein